MASKKTKYDPSKWANLPRKREKFVPKGDADSLPCVRVVVGAKPGVAAPSDAKGCVVVGENRVRVEKAELRRDIASTSKSVATPKKNKPCQAFESRSGCPVQLAFDRGQPFLRFCRAKDSPGYRVDISSAADAVEKSQAACRVWKETGSFDFAPSTPMLGRAARFKRTRR